MRYVQGMGNEYNPEVVAFLLERSDEFRFRDGSTYDFGISLTSRYEYQAIQALLCEQKFRDYAEC